LKHEARYFEAIEDIVCKKQQSKNKLKIFAKDRHNNKNLVYFIHRSKHCGTSQHKHIGVENG
jgi:hypothetical protein